MDVWVFLVGAHNLPSPTPSNVSGLGFWLGLSPRGWEERDRLDKE